MALKTAAFCEAPMTGAPTVTVYPLPTITTVAPSMICYNTTANLTATPGGGTTPAMTYTWTIGGVSSTTTVNSKTSQSLTVNNTTYTVSVKNTNGCTATTNAAPIPVSGVFTQNPPVAQTICNNNTATFNVAAASGGVTPINYQWQQSPDGVNNWTTAQGASTNAAYTTPALTGNMYYRRLAHCAACGTVTSATALVTVLSPAKPTLNHNGPKCSGEYITFSATGSTGYTWTLPAPGSGNTMNTPASTASNYQASVKAVQNANGVTCYSDPATTSATIYQTPEQPGLSSSGTTCEGNSITFTASGSSENYTWGGDFNGTGQIRTSTTSAGPKYATVNAYTEPSGTLMCSSTSAATSSEVLRPSSSGNTANACGCQPDLSKCTDDACRPSCKTCSLVQRPNTNCYTQWADLIKVCPGQLDMTNARIDCKPNGSLQHCYGCLDANCYNQFYGNMSVGATINCVVID
jgi:hypothetical protein